MQAAEPEGESRGLRVVAVLYFALLVLPLTVGLGGIALTGTRILLIVVALPLFIQLLRGRYGPLILTDGLLLAHVAVMGLTLMVTSPELAVTQFGSLGTEIYGSYLLGRAWVRTPDDFARLCRWLVGLVVAALPFALIEARTGRTLILDALAAVPGTSTHVNVDADRRLGLDRVQLSFPHPIHFGVFCAASFSMIMVALRQRTSRTVRFGLGALCAFAALLSLSSGSLLAIVFQMGLIGWSVLTRSVPARWRILVGVLVLLYIGIDLASNRTPVQVFMSYATFSSHTAYWRALIFEHGLQNVWDSPWVGIGFNDWDRPRWMHTDSIDNYWLVLAMRHGVFGFLTMAAAWAALLIRTARRPLPEGGEAQSQRLGYMFVMLGLIFSFATVHAWSNIHAFAYLLLGAGAWFGTASASVVAGANVEAAPVGPRRLPGPVRKAPVPTSPPAPAAPPSKSPRRRGEARHSRFDPIHRRAT